MCVCVYVHGILFLLYLSSVPYFVVVFTVFTVLVMLGYCGVAIAALFWLVHLIGFRMGAIVHLDKLIFKYLCCTNSTQCD